MALRLHGVGDDRHTGTGTDGQVVVQGSGAWAVDTEVDNEMSTVGISDGKTVWDLKPPDGENVWLVGDGNRVFARCDGNLMALPVF